MIALPWSHILIFFYDVKWEKIFQKSLSWGGDTLRRSMHKLVFRTHFFLFYTPETFIYLFPSRNISLNLFIIEHFIISLQFSYIYVQLYLFAFLSLDQSFLCNYIMCELLYKLICKLLNTIICDLISKLIEMINCLVTLSLFCCKIMESVWT